MSGALVPLATRCRKRAALPLVLLSGSLLACQSGDASKSWSALATCLAGPAASAPVAERVQKLRLAQLGNLGTAGEQAWPGRCSAHAQALYQAATDAKPLRNKLAERLHCSDEPKSCSLSADGSFVSTAMELWEAAAAAGLKLEAAPGVEGPKLIAPAVTDEAHWKSFSAEPGRVVGPRLNADGSATIVLAPKEGRGRLDLCKVSVGLEGINCALAHEGVPQLPGSGVQLTTDVRGPYAAGLTPEGLFAFNLETGERSDVRGASGNLVSDGVAVEAGTMLQPPGQRVAVVGGGLGNGIDVSITKSTKGFVAVELREGKASKDVALDIQPVGQPAVWGGQLVFVSGEGEATALEAQSFNKGRFQPAARLPGPFVGQLRSCSEGDRMAVATFGGHRGEHGAKPTLGADKTQFSIAFRTGATWSKAFSATLPFDRAIDSGLVCTKAGASVAWARSVQDGIEVSRLDCNADGCKAREVKLPGVESKWWWGIAPLGDKLLLVWRSSLGDTRFRIAPFSDFAAGTDQLLFDTPDFGGPKAGEATQVVSEAAALLLFNEARPIAIRIGADGSARQLAKP